VVVLDGPLIGLVAVPLLLLAPLAEYIYLLTRFGLSPWVYGVTTFALPILDNFLDLWLANICIEEDVPDLCALRSSRRPMQFPTDPAVTIVYTD